MTHNYVICREKWINGVVVKKSGPLTYLIPMDDLVIWKRHVVQLKINYDTSETIVSKSDGIITPVLLPTRASDAIAQSNINSPPVHDTPGEVVRVNEES